MTRTRRAMAALLAILSLAIAAPVAVASFTSDHKCSPGQHGNPDPGFKPGSC